MQIPDINYQLRSIDILNVNINPRPTGFTGENFHFDISATVRVIPEKKIVFLVIDITTRELDKEGNLGFIQTAIGFEVEDFEEVIIKNENGYQIPTDFEVTLRTISISTTRGIMYSHFKGTHLHKAVLPIIPQLVTPVEE